MWITDNIEITVDPTVKPILDIEDSWLSGEIMGMYC